MENSNRNDVSNFFKDMPPEMQQEVINKMQIQIKKPPDHDAEVLESEVVQNLEAIR